ncbi:MAG: hypothetical protein ABI591_21025 [Kofleriaceae bacterium]
MLTRLAAIALALTTTASAGEVARPPQATEPNPIAVRAAPSRKAVREALAKRREHNQAAFFAYVARGVYPHNTYRTGPLNVWRDANGHLCAAATMISKDGHDELAQQTAQANNNLRLLDVVDGPLLDWMLTSGFTIEEIDRIQLPNMEPPIVSPRTLAAEDAKLKKSYTATEALLKKQVKADLDTATARLLANPTLAWQLVEG